MSGGADPEGTPDRQYRIAVHFDTGREAERIGTIPGSGAHRYRGVVLTETPGAQPTGLPSDRADTVEAVRIGNPAPDTCTTKVLAQNTPFPRRGTRCAPPARPAKRS
ncbi:hypothetical protein [Kitasatospora sp. NPDC007106]|uniref:hypothetical protein n=1 Tax=Kitasatospora sp. NPDC007106 TaxID=3156914 RepID=UPI0033DBA4D0